MDNITFRPATRDDAPDLVRLTRALAADMGREGEVAATVEDVAAGLFGEGAGEAVVVEHAEAGVVGCAIFCRTYSAWTGRCGMYLEDLFIEGPYRGGGVGRALMAHLAELCEQRGWARLSWHCRTTNGAGLRFYERLGAARIDAMLLHRLEGASLAALAGEVAAAPGTVPASAPASASDSAANAASEEVR